MSTFHGEIMILQLSYPLCDLIVLPDLEKVLLNRTRSKFWAFPERL